MNSLKVHFGDYIVDYIMEGRGRWKNISLVFTDQPNLLPTALDL